MTRLAEHGIAPLAPDFRFVNHGTLWLLQMLSEAARVWAAEKIAEDAMEFGGGIVVEPRYVDSIVAGIREAGLIVTEG